MVTLGKFKIFLGHMLVNGAKLGPNDYHAASPIAINEILERWEADLYLIGDVHKAQKLRDAPPMLYVGSPERRDFGERNEKKGFTLITASDKLEYKFITLDTRPMIQFDLTYAELGDWLEDSEKFVKQPDVKDALVKVKITCSKEEYHRINELDIREKLKEAKQVFPEYDVIKKARYDLPIEAWKDEKEGLRGRWYWTCYDFLPAHRESGTLGEMEGSDNKKTNNIN